MRIELHVAVKELLDASQEMLEKTTGAAQKKARERLQATAAKVRELIDQHESDTTSVIG